MAIGCGLFYIRFMPFSFSPRSVFPRMFGRSLALLAFGVFPCSYSDNTPPPGFRSLFDGKSLEGWTPKARLPVPKYPGAPFNVDPNGAWMKKARRGDELSSCCLVGGLQRTRKVRQS